MNKFRRAADELMAQLIEAEKGVDKLRDELIELRTKCPHQSSTWIGGDKWCDDCGAIIN